MKKIILFTVLLCFVSYSIVAQEKTQEIDISVIKKDSVPENLSKFKYLVSEKATKEEIAFFFVLSANIREAMKNESDSIKRVRYDTLYAIFEPYSNTNPPRDVVFDLLSELNKYKALLPAHMRRRRWN